MFFPFKKLHKTSPFILVSVLVLLLFCTTVYPQSGRQETEVAVYNIVFGGIIGGVGAVINKPKNTQWKKVFVKGFWQGTIGGGLNYGGKKILYQINKKDEKIFAWPAKILHAAGMSIIENAALNEPFLQNWNINYGPVRFDFSVGKKHRFKARLLPVALLASYWASKSGSFDLKSTLITGNIVFRNYNAILIKVGDNYFEGYSFGRAIGIGQEWIGTNTILAHEIVHEFQYDDFQLLNTWLKPIEKKISNKFLLTIFKNYVYFDTPFFWLAYSIAGRKHQNYYSNFFEFEAERFATNKYVPR